MNQNEDELVSSLRRLTSLNREELADLSVNYKDYIENGTFNELLELANEYQKLESDLSRLNSEFARINYDSYEKYMGVHVNAIVISGMKRQIELMGRKIPDKVLDEIEEILEKYLMIEGF